VRLHAPSRGLPLPTHAYSEIQSNALVRFSAVHLCRRVRRVASAAASSLRPGQLIVPTGFQRAAHRESADGPREFNAVVCLVK
jgi:hypothetical protein